MRELVRTTQVVGLKQLLKLRRAQQMAWPGMMNGFYGTRFVQALFNVGFFDQLQAQGKVDLEQFAAAQNLDVRILRSVCDALYAFSILEKDGNVYTAAPKGQLILDVARGWFDAAYGYEEVFHNLEALLRKQVVYGKGLTRKADFVAKGSGEIEAWLYFPLAIDFITRGGYKHVLDLGCGDGTFLRHVCRKNSRARGSGIDIAPAAVADGEALLKQDGLAERIKLYVEDISKLDRVPEALVGVDVATVFFVLHELLYTGAQRVVAFLNDFKRLFPGVPLLVYEVDRPTVEEMRRRPGMAVPYVVQHDVSHQQLVTGDEWKRLFAQAGFTHVEERHLSFARSLVFIVK
jgi:SAM-dependent methyltransferase